MHNFHIYWSMSVRTARKNTSTISKKACLMSKIWWHAATLFIYFYINRADIQYFYILLGENHSCYLHCFRSVEGLLWGAEPRFELGPAVQQADALLSEPRRTLTEPRRTLLNHACLMSTYIRKCIIHLCTEDIMAYSTKNIKNLSFFLSVVSFFILTDSS